ncbi:MAG: TonB-dependent receptor, partial [Bacteroidetes bacterium]
APQVFVDGRPTTLTLDQIPADIIESVEVITNPSAKYDASGGQAGIVNIVLKKDRRIGYYGGIRAGVDTRGGFNAGGNVNIREGDVNTFISANLNQFANQGTGVTERENFFGDPRTSLVQRDTSRFVGQFANVRAGVDWFVNNRNTITFSGSFTRGQFRPTNRLFTHTDSLFEGYTSFSESIRESESERMFRNLGASVLFKHLFPKDGMEWTADINYNRVNVEGEGSFQTQFLNNSFSSREQQLSNGGTHFVTAQTDFVNPITDKIKLEMGARAAIRRFDNNTYNYLFDAGVNDFVYIPTFFDEYQYTDAVYAAYGTFSHQFAKWGYQAGLRVESSQYDGVLGQTGETFDNDFPFSVFPSLFVTRKIDETDNLQFSYSRRINRPNFFQLMPFVDFSDSLNLRRGNPDLLPEFTNSLEVTYQNILNKNHDILVSAYFKQADNLITSYLTTEYFEQFGRDVVMASYANSAQSMAYGVEFTMRNTFLEIFELTSNVNLYNSRVDASNVEADLVNDQFTWFVKENLNVRLPGKIRLQVIGEYRSRTAFSVGGGGRFGGWRGVSNTAQGYTIPVWFVDVALRKDFFNRKLNVTLGMNDIFRSRINGSYSESAFFIQESSSLRNPQIVRFNLAYNFGKPDMSLFKRKNNRVNMEGMDMM